MKMRIVKTSLLTFLTLLSLNWIFYVNCPQTDIFTGDSLFLFIKSTSVFIIGCLIWMIGYLFFLKFERFHDILEKYFILLTVLASFYLVNSILVNGFSSDRQTIQAICSKSSDDGMFCSMDKLTFNEYMYLYEKSGWLPPIPLHSENVIIDYYRDDLLGDYTFNMLIELPSRPKLDTIQFPELKKVLFEEKNKLEGNLIHSDRRPFGENTYFYSLSSDE